MSDIVRSEANEFDSGIAVGLAGTFRLLGGSIATAIYTSIVNNEFASSLPGKLSGEVEGLGFPSSSMDQLLAASAANTAAAYAAVPGISQPVIAAASLAVKQAYVAAFRTTYLAAIGFGGAAIVAAFFTENIDRKMKNSNRAVRLENESKVEESKQIDV